MGILNLFRKPKTPQPNVIEKILPPEEFKYIWSHQLVVVTGSRINLRKQMFTISRDVSLNRKNYIDKFPFVVGDHGNLISVSFVRCVFCDNDHQKSSVYLEYVLNKELRTKVILRIVGNDPQSIYIQKNERIENDQPLVLIIPKLKRHPGQEP